MEGEGIIEEIGESDKEELEITCCSLLSISEIIFLLWPAAQLRQVKGKLGFSSCSL